MKRLILVFSFFVVWQLQAQDQSSSSSAFSIGPKIGYQVNATRTEGADFHGGMRFGITSTYSITERSGVGVDLMYSSQNYDVDANVSYLKIPLLYKFFFGKLGNSFRPRVDVGFTPGLLLSAKAGEVDIKDSFKSFEVGVAGGLGFNYRIADRTWLNVDYLLDYGLTDLTKVSDSKNVGHSFNVGVAFGL